MRTVFAGPGVRRVDPAAVAAVLLAVVSLGLPWRNSHFGFGYGSEWVPGYCHITYDGYSWCDSGSIVFGTTTEVKGPVPGFQSPSRVLVLAAVVLFLLALRAAHRAAGVAFCAAAAVAVFLGGATPASGRVLFLVAAVYGALLLRRRGLLHLRPHPHPAARRGGGPGQPAAST